jgi:type IV pilus assembly protein PilY1
MAMASEPLSPRGSAFAAAGRIYFGTSTADTEDPCDTSGESGANDGKIFVFDDTTGTSMLNDEDGDAGKRVGNVYTPPVVYDRHLYVKTPTGLVSFGEGSYNNDLNAGGMAQASKTSWREVF